MSFAFPWSFLLALPLGVAAWRMLRRGRQAGIKFSAVGWLPAKTAGWRARVANVAPWLFLVGAALLVVAAARPRRARAHSPAGGSTSRPRAAPPAPCTAGGTRPHSRRANTLYSV